MEGDIAPCSFFRGDPLGWQCPVPPFRIAGRPAVPTVLPGDSMPRASTATLLSGEMGGGSGRERDSDLETEKI